jgi:translation initiation factor 4G
MSPRNPPLSLQQVPGTPSQSHAIPPILQPPHPSVPHPPPSVASPPPTPSAPPTRPTSLSANAGAFVPGKKISIKHPSSGQEVSVESLKHTRTPPAPAPIPPSPPSIKQDLKRQPIRIESQEQKEKRLAEERAKDGKTQEKSRPSEASVRANEDAARREIEEHERREAEERKAKEEERKEAEERAAVEKERKEAEERAVRQEAERKEAEARAAREAREKEEQAKERSRLEEEARAKREALELAEKERAEQERLRKIQEEEETRAREEAERQRKAEEDAIEASADAQVLVDDAEPTSLPEEGEVSDDASQPAVPTEELSSANKGTPALSSSPAPHVLAELPDKPSEKEPLRIDTSLPSPEPQRRRPGPLNLQATINTNIPPSLPSALATARHIEDINRITYPQGIKSPRLELNVNTQKGKFRYVLNLHVPLRALNAIAGMTAISYYSL